jgi:hypothetical protein
VQAEGGGKGVMLTAATAGHMAVVRVEGMGRQVGQGGGGDVQGGYGQRRGRRGGKWVPVGGGSGAETHRTRENKAGDSAPADVVIAASAGTTSAARVERRAAVAMRRTIRVATRAEG